VRVSCSAPGKLVLLGEYAVVYGHPAVVAAVDRRAHVRLVEPSGGRCSVAARGLAAAAFFRLGAKGALAWEDPAARLSLVERLLAAMTAQGSLDAPPAPFAAVLDTRPFFTAGAPPAKLGLGSSAALTVALASALQRWAGASAPTSRLARLGPLVALHRELQGGRGSGIDVASALLGGVLEYRLAGTGEPCCAGRLSLPSDLRLLAIWTGRPADTRAYLAHMEKRLASDGEAVVPVLEELGGISRAGVEALRSGGGAGWLAAVDAYVDALEGLGRVAGLDIVSEEHRRIRRLVAAHDGRYKPSGAGGGDVGVAFLPGPDAARAAAAAASRAGFTPLALAVTPTGLRLRALSG
jgi:phosphomevalonate kinase